VLNIHGELRSTILRQQSREAARARASSPDKAEDPNGVTNKGAEEGGLASLVDMVVGPRGEGSKGQWDARTAGDEAMVGAGGDGGGAGAGGINGIQALELAYFPTATRLGGSIVLCCAELHMESANHNLP
jgi:hypothetical protein